MYICIVSYDIFGVFFDGKWTSRKTVEKWDILDRSKRDMFTFVSLENWNDLVMCFNSNIVPTLSLVVSYDIPGCEIWLPIAHCCRLYPQLELLWDQLDLSLGTFFVNVLRYFCTSAWLHASQPKWIRKIEECNWDRSPDKATNKFTTIWVLMIRKAKSANAKITLPVWTPMTSICSKSLFLGLQWVLGFHEDQKYGGKLMGQHELFTKISMGKTSAWTWNQWVSVFSPD